MEKKTNIFGDGKEKNIPNYQQKYNIFGKDNDPNNKKMVPSYNNQGSKTMLTDLKMQGENNNININNNMNKLDNIQKSFKKKQNNLLKESINLNLLPNDDSNIETNSTTNNKNEMININNNKRPNSFVKKNNKININNNMNPNTQIKNQVKNKFNNNFNDVNIKNINPKGNKDNIVIKIDNIEDNNIKANNNDIEKNNKKQNIKEKKNLYKSMMIFDDKKEENKENKVKTKKKEIGELKKKRENEKNKAEILDQLKCYICMDKLKKPRMCPSCHRPACENCIKNWLNMKHQCGFCRKKINYNETIEIPIINDIAEFFMKNIEPVENKNENKKDNKNDKNYDSQVYDSYSEIIEQKLQNDEDICKKHMNKYEYFCYQCNKKYCAKCLSILDNSSKVHENHLIISLDELEKNDTKVKEAMEEFRKLKQSNDEIDNLIKLSELKLRELEIEKNNFIDEIDSIKEEINAKSNDSLFSVSSNYNGIKSKISDFANSIDTTPTALKNLITLKDYGQGQQIFEHLSNLNKCALDNNFIDLPKEHLFIETFISKPIEIVIANEGNIKLKDNEQVNKLIPNYDMKLTFENFGNNICLRINLNKKGNNDLDNEKIFCFVIFRNQKYGCEFIKMKQGIGYHEDEIQLYTNISTNTFFSFQDENNKILYKLYFMVYKS